jgi:hypothetical protein
MPLLRIQSPVPLLKVWSPVPLLRVRSLNLLHLSQFVEVQTPNLLKSLTAEDGEPIEHRAEAERAIRKNLDRQ